tara:strand:- start:1355 stop:1558 length:204 start_codon:yes stop_codon:yes gene_type:complete
VIAYVFGCISRIDPAFQGNSGRGGFRLPETTVAAIGGPGGPEAGAHRISQSVKLKIIYKNSELLEVD